MSEVKRLKGIGLISVARSGQEHLVIAEFR
jgi:hypothetical protein